MAMSPQRTRSEIRMAGGAGAHKDTLMTADAEVRISTAIVAVATVSFAAYESAGAFAPLAIALFE